MVNGQLVKKILRSMWSAKTSYISCVFVISIGIICYCTLRMTCDSLQYSVDTYYADTRFADVFAKVTGFPQNRLPELLAIGGVAGAQGRITENGRLITEDRGMIVTLKLIGVDLSGPGASDQLNMYYASGGDIEADDDILLGNEFLAARGISQGDEIEVALYGRAWRFTVKGAAQSPEYVYTMPEDGSLFPDPASFGIAFVRMSTLERMSGRGAAATDLAFALEEGRTFDDVKGPLEDALTGYGLTALYSRDDQPSNMMVKQEFDSIDAMSGSMSGLFLFIAAIILYIMLRRLVEHERTQIGTLKAFGYTNTEIMCAYALYGLITGLAGGLAGALLSVPLSAQYFALFSEYFNIPKVDTQVRLDYLVNGVLMSVGSGAAAAVVGVKNIIKLNPADAMRPSAPAYITGSLVDRVPFLPSLLTKRGMMALRFIGRNKLKSAMIVFSVSLSFALMTVGFSFDQLIASMMTDQFTKAQTFDIKATLKIPAGRDAALSAITAVDGVRDAEGVIELPVTLENQNRQRTVAITGLNPGSDKYRIVDDSGGFHEPPKNGLLITQNYADSMHIKKGDVVTLKSPLLPDDRPVPIVEVIGTGIGAGCYMDAFALSELARQPAFVNTVVLRVEEGASARVREALIEGRNIASVDDINRILQNYEDTMAAYTSLIYLVLLMAILVAFAVIYNISSISLAERQRELATMRVLGLSAWETSGVLTFEHWVLFAASICAGVPLTVAMRYGLAESLNNELYSMPVHTPVMAFLCAAASCAVSVLLANLMARRNIGRFSLVEVLKERE